MFSNYLLLIMVLHVGMALLVVSHVLSEKYESLTDIDYSASIEGDVVG